MHTLKQQLSMSFSQQTCLRGKYIKLKHQTTTYWDKPHSKDYHKSKASLKLEFLCKI
jgi:hypothetical protein